MKVEADLRMAINAAARSQKELTHAERDAAEDKSINKFFDSRKAARKKAVDLKKKYLAARDQADKIAKEMREVLQPFGLRFDEEGNRNKHRIEIAYGEESKAKFVQAGGELPPVQRRKWSADEVTAKLAKAKPEQKEAILAEYGINWQ